MNIARLDEALTGAGRALLDTSSLVSFHNRAEVTHELARHILRRIERDDDPMQGLYSVGSAAELLVRLFRASATQVAFLHTFLSSFPNLTVLPVDLTDAIQAATIRAGTNLRLPDAIIVASGMLAGCDAIVTNDEASHRRLAPLFPMFRWLYLADYAQ